MNKYILFIIVILILVSTIAGSFVLYKNKTKEKVINFDQVKIENNIVTTTTETKEKIDWNKIYEHDKDRDGVSDEKEKELGLSDLEFDTDHDSLSDKSEIEKWHTDPKNKDTDGDGYGDAIEILNGYNPLGPGKLEN